MTAKTVSTTKNEVEVTLSVDSVVIAGVKHTKSKTPTVNVSQATANRMVSHGVGIITNKKGQ